MKNTVIVALTGMIAASAMVASTADASAHRARHHHRHHHHQSHGNPGAALAVGTFFGLALGAATAPMWAPYPVAPPPLYAPAPYLVQTYQPARIGPTTHAAWCASQYPDYRAADNTWIDEYGAAQICYSPY